MNPRVFARNTTKPGSIKFMILTVCVAICLTAGWQSPNCRLLKIIWITRMQTSRMPLRLSMLITWPPRRHCRIIEWRERLRAPKRAGTPGILDAPEGYLMKKKTIILKKSQICANPAWDGAILQRNWMCILPF